MKASMRCLAVVTVALLGSSSPGDTTLQYSFKADEGFASLEGQMGWEPGFMSATSDPCVECIFNYGSLVNTHDPGLGGDPGRIELWAVSESTAPKLQITEVTGEATFTAWFNKNGNIQTNPGDPDDFTRDPDDFARRGSSGMMLLVGTIDRRPGSANEKQGQAVYIRTRDSLEGRFISYQRNPDTDCSGFMGCFGIAPYRPPPALPEMYPPDEGWWGVRADLHWDENAGESGRYTNWDFYYKEEQDPDWTLIEADLRFKTEDSEGYYPHVLNAIRPYVRPCGGCGDVGDGPNRLLMDNVSIGPPGGPPVYHSDFSADEGYMMLAGQNGWINPGTPSGVVNLSVTGPQGHEKPPPSELSGYVELIADQQSFPSKPFEARSSGTTFIGWFNRRGIIPEVYDPDDEHYDPDRPGHSGLQVALGDDSYDLDDAAVYITTRDTDHAIQYQKGPDGEMGIGPTPPDAGWWGVRADVVWDPTADGGRFTSWDLHYKLEEDPDWTLIEEGLGFRSQDADGYDHDLNALMTWNRPCVECGDSDGFGQNRILMDSLFVGDCEVCEVPLLPGDIDSDGDVDFTDFSILAGNFTGTLDPAEGGKTRDDGDFDGDGDVDFSDFSTLAGNFTGTITAPASDVPGESEVHLEIDLTNDGAMKLEATSADLAGYSIRSSDSQLVPDADAAAAPFMFYLLNAVQEVTAGSVGSATTLTEDLALDISFAGDADQAANVVFQYTRAGDVTPVDGVVHVIPEPATMILLAAGGLLVLPRRRRRCA